MKPGCQIVGSVTIEWLTTEADDQSSLHCVVVSTGAMSDHIVHRDASHGGGCSKYPHAFAILSNEVWVLNQDAGAIQKIISDIVSSMTLNLTLSIYLHCVSKRSHL